MYTLHDDDVNAYCTHTPRGFNKCIRGFATARARSLRIAFVPIVILLVAVAFFLVLLFLIRLFSKEDISGH